MIRSILMAATLLAVESSSAFAQDTQLEPIITVPITRQPTITFQPRDIAPLVAPDVLSPGVVRPQVVVPRVTHSMSETDRRATTLRLLRNSAIGLDRPGMDALLIQSIRVVPPRVLDRAKRLELTGARPTLKDLGITLREVPIAPDKFLRLVPSAPPKEVDPTFTPRVSFADQRSRREVVVRQWSNVAADQPSFPFSAEAMAKASLLLPYEARARNMRQETIRYLPPQIYALPFFSVVRERMKETHSTLPVMLGGNIVVADNASGELGLLPLEAPVPVAFRFSESESTQEEFAGFCAGQEDRAPGPCAQTQVYIAKMTFGLPCEEDCRPSAVGLHDGFKLVCSGVLVAPNWVLTAAHCTCDAALNPRRATTGYEAPPSLWASLGVSRTASVTGVVAYKNPGFCPAYLDGRTMEAYAGGDLALVQLTSFLDDTNSQTAKVVTDTQFASADRVEVAGFGARENSSRGGLKKAGRLNIDRDGCLGQDCFQDHEFKLIDESGMLDSCYGDSGGGVYAPSLDGRDVALGIVSRGVTADCGTGGIYTRLDSTDVHTWIQSITGQNPVLASGATILADFIGEVIP